MKFRMVPRGGIEPPTQGFTSINAPEKKHTNGDIDL